MIEGIVLGIIQGVAEWIPVSSEGMIALAEINLFHKTGIEEIIRLALFLHLGTFLAALIYFRKDIWKVIKNLFNYKRLENGEKNILNFLVVSTLISGVLGFFLLKLITSFESQLEFSGKIFTALIGILLLVTAWLQLHKKTDTTRPENEVTLADSFWLGIAQGLAVFPGLSRSGLTISTLLLRKVSDEASLKLSFLMSLPIVLAGNIVLNLNSITLSTPSIWGLIFSFIFGLGTIHILMKIARRVNFGYFVGIFGILMILAALV